MAMLLCQTCSDSISDMSLAQHAPAVETDFVFSPDGARHIWLPTRRSLCDLTSQRVGSARDVDTVNQAAQALPACGACVEVASILARRADAIVKESGVTPISVASSRSLLKGTRWPWAISALAE